MEISLFPKSAIHLLSKITQIPEYPISGTGFSSKPAVDCQLTIVNYSEPEELAIGNNELDGIENEMDLEVISKEINRKDPLAGRVFDLLAFHGYQLEDIARMK